MTDVLLLSWTKLKQYSDINDSVDPDLLKNNIRLSQDIELQRVIGTLLYQKLLDLVEAGTMDDSGNAVYKTLLVDYVQPMLLYAAYYETLESIYIRPRNNGLLTPQGGENSINVDRQVYDMKRQSVRNKMEFYADKLTRYLSEEEASYPELSENTKLYQQVADYGSQYFAPIVFSSNTRARYLNLARRAGLPIVDSAYDQYPPPRFRNNRF
tara:strand:+ start:1501 stop:2133 length:633 start_codon:yes stop_codon:yes gene_type:complete